MCTQKMRALSYIGAEKITFPPKSDGRADLRTGIRTDKGNYRVASLLTNNIITYKATLQQACVFKIAIV